MKRGWEIKKLSELFTIKPPKKLAKEKLDDEDEISFVPMACLNIEDRDLSLKQSKQLKDAYKGYTYFADNDVLLAKITPCFENGKVGIAKGLLNGIGFGSSEFIVFRPNGHVVPEYLYYYLSQESFRDEGKNRMAGAVGHKRVSKEFIEEYLLPFPESTKEQNRIVAILDKAFTAIDKAKANAEKNLANAKKLFESYLNGIFENPGKDWEERKLNEISENLDSQRIPITKRDRKSGKIPYYGASGIVDYVADFIFDEDLLCISEDGANLLARTYPIAFSITGKTWVNNHAHILRFKEMTTQKFVELYMNSIKLDDFVSGMAQPKLNQTMLNKIPILFPPLKKQKSIIQKSDDLSAETQKLEDGYQQKIDSLNELKKSILQKAFVGEL